MKISQTIPAMMLGLAATVTAGSVYVTVQAAAQQESEAIAVPSSSSDEERSIEVIEVSSGRIVDDVLNTRGHFLAIDEDGAFTGRLLTLPPKESKLPLV